MRLTDVLLVRCRLSRADALAEAARQFCLQGGELRLLQAAWSSTEGWAYVYGQLPAATAIGEDAVVRSVRLWARLCPSAQDTDLSRLQLVQDLPGHSARAVPMRHYVVETDPEAGWEDELADWYAREHMPGLAAVPGCVRARRFINHDAGPRSHACYELVTEDTLGSPPWLAVRGTEWSSRVRPHFTNTRRTMMQVVRAQRR